MEDLSFQNSALTIHIITSVIVTTSDLCSSKERNDDLYVYRWIKGGCGSLRTH